MKNSLLLLLTLSTLVSCGTKEEGKPVVQDIKELVFASGELEWDNSYNLTAQTDGILINATFFGFFALIGFRLIVKTIFYYIHKDEFPESEKENIAIVGVNSQNIALIEPLNSISSKYNLICAGVIISLLPALIVFITCQKQIYNGITSGSVKG